MRPHQLLPLPPPSEYDPSIADPDYFYKNVLLPLNKDFVRIMSNGLLIDYDAAETLRDTVTSVVEQVQQTLNANPIIIAFQNTQYTHKYAEYLAEMETKKKTIQDFIKPYKPDDMFHRTYVVNTILEVNELSQYICTKWTIADIKKFLTIEHIPAILSVLNSTLSADSPYVVTAIHSIAKEKMRIYNKSHYEDKVSTVTREKILPPFNPGSSTQKRLLFEFLKIEPLAYSDTSSEASWGRDQIEEILYATPETDVDLRQLLQCFVDHSYSAIIKNNFMEAFDKFTVDGYLRGNLNLAGAKSYRPTSNSPNLLNTPSTGSIYSKPLKKCFIAPEGWLIWSIDYGQLEDRVIANLSKDEGKCNIFLKDLDSHCYNALGYFPDRIAEHMTLTGDKITDAIEFKRLVDEGHKELKVIRQDGKPCTFGISYGSHPPKIASTIKCSIEEATAIFNGYHQDLYPGITHFREDVILKQASKKGYVHMGLGARIYTDDVNKDSRTLFNSVSQFWSMLTLIAINELHHHIDEEERDDILVNATIYDAIYGIVKADAESIKWLNDTIVPILVKPWLIDETVHNTASLEVGTSWANLHEVANDATIDQIKEIIYA